MPLPSQNQVWPRRAAFQSFRRYLHRLTSSYPLVEAGVVIYLARLLQLHRVHHHLEAYAADVFIWTPL